MASKMVQSNKKGKYLVCRKDELLSEFGKFFDKMWKTCQCCGKKVLFKLQRICFCFKKSW